MQSRAEFFQPKPHDFSGSAWNCTASTICSGSCLMVDLNKGWLKGEGLHLSGGAFALYAEAPTFNPWHLQLRRAREYVIDQDGEPCICI